jgi:hypothetical protein
MILCVPLWLNFHPQSIFRLDNLPGKFLGRQGHHVHFVAGGVKVGEEQALHPGPGRQTAGFGWG